MTENKPHGGTDTDHYCLSIEKACTEYNNSVKLTLHLIQDNITDTLNRNYAALEELALRIELRALFLENNPSFLSCLTGATPATPRDPMSEFLHLKTDIHQSVDKLIAKIDDTERYHNRLLDRLMHSAAPLTPKDSFDQVTIHRGRSLQAPAPPTPPLFTSDVSPEVQKGRPTVNLHDKLIKQVKNSDSLEGFQRLMNRRPEKKMRPGRKNSKELEKKYAGSLWFFPPKGEKPQGVKRKRSSRMSVSSQRSIKSTESKKRSQVFSCDISVKSQPLPWTHPGAHRRARTELSTASNRLKCYDILDDIDGNTLKPIHSEYPRRDNFHTIHAAKNKSYLQVMLAEDEKVWKKLLLPKGKAAKNTPIQLPPLPSPQAPPSTPEEVETLTLMEYLTAPQHRFTPPATPQAMIVMPVKVVYDHVPVKGDAPKRHVVGSRPVVASPRPRSSTNSSPSTATPRFSFQATPRPTGGHAHDPKPTKSTTLPFHRRKAMLEHLHGLKARNDCIQKNIQKAIDVIETKMIDLLSGINTSNNCEAFHAMETEITKVLEMMNDEEVATKDETSGGDLQGGLKPLQLKISGGDIKPLQLKAERDVPAPRTKHGLTVVRKLHGGSPIANFLPGVDLRNFPKMEEPPRETEPKKSRVSFRATALCSAQARSASSIGSEPKDTPTVKAPPHVDAPPLKKFANMEEGELLLDKVDDVIKKIDGIYAKYHDGGKVRSDGTKEEKSFYNVLDFFDGLSKAPKEELSRRYDDILKRFQQAVVKEVGTGYSEAVVNYPKMMERGDGTDEDVTMVGWSEDWGGVERRHETVLKTFYTMFFSGVLVALNMDFAC